jgi:hypothetical protein
MPPHRRRNNFTVISYHYDAVTLRRTDFIETTIGEHGQEGEIEERPVQLRLFVGDNQYTTSMSRLYHQRNINLRPHIYRREDQRREGGRTDYVDHGININAPIVFMVSSDFRRRMERFAKNLFTSFPDIACAYCGILSLRRSIKWLNEEEAASNEHLFGLVRILNLPVYRDSQSRVAVCGLCRKRPRKCVDAGPWPDVLKAIPQRSKMFLSPVKLNCNLGRTQSLSTGDRHNPYSTYRTLSGILVIIGLGS